MTALSQIKKDLISDIKAKKDNKIIKSEIADLLIKLVSRADTIDEAIAISGLGIMQKETGFYFNPKPENNNPNLKTLLRNDALSFSDGSNRKNTLIIGDNYDALSKLLNTHKSTIDVIYIDPPYGINKSGKCANTNYKNSIIRDNLLSMLYSRLIIARQLLSDDGTIFCSIDDNNYTYVKCLFDEIFKEENFVSDIIWQSKYTISNDKKNNITTQTEHILCYAKNIEAVSFQALPLRKEYVERTYRYNDNDGRGPYRLVQLYKKKNPKSFDVVSPTGKVWNKPWNYTPKTFKQLERENKVYWGTDGNACPSKKVFLSDSKGMGSGNLWLGCDVGYQLSGGDMIEKIFNNRNIFSYPKPVSLIMEILKIASKPDSIVLDFFAGSGTTGQSVLELNEIDGGNRSFILCTNNEITATTPNGIAYDVTSKRLKRIMTGECYDGFFDFEWIKKNKPFGGTLDVYELKNI